MVNYSLMADYITTFPTDVMREVFDPEVIIGSNVSSNEDPPKEGDAISQLRNLVVSKNKLFS